MKSINVNDLDLPNAPLFREAVTLLERDLERDKQDFVRIKFRPDSPYEFYHLPVELRGYARTQDGSSFDSLKINRIFFDRYFEKDMSNPNHYRSKLCVYARYVDEETEITASRGAQKVIAPAFSYVYTTSGGIVMVVPYPDFASRFARTTPSNRRIDLSEPPDKQQAWALEVGDYVHLRDIRYQMSEQARASMRKSFVDFGTGKKAFRVVKNG